MIVRKTAKVLASLFLVVATPCESFQHASVMRTRSGLGTTKGLLASRTDYPSQSDKDHSTASSSPLVWTSRRGMMASTIAAAVGPVLVNMVASSPSSAAVSPTPSATSKASWMADPGDSFEKARAALAMEANLAAQKVTREIREEYHRNGVTAVKGVVSSRWIQALREGCEVAQDEAGPYSEYLQKATDDGIFFTDLELARRLPLFSAFSLFGPCAAVAGAVMGSSSIRYLYDQLFVKEQGVSTHTPWHQDGGYWRVTGPQIGSVFVPLDPVKAKESLAFVTGSQNWELHNPQHFADGTPYTGTSLPPMPDVDAMVTSKKVELKTFDLEPGDVLVFSAKTTHGGPGNWGRALSTRWTGDDCTYWARPGEGAVPTGEIGLQDGELLSNNDAAFPQAWSSSDAATTEART